MIVVLASHLVTGICTLVRCRFLAYFTSRNQVIGVGCRLNALTFVDNQKWKVAALLFCCYVLMPAIPSFPWDVCNPYRCWNIANLWCASVCIPKRQRIKKQNSTFCTIMIKIQFLLHVHTLCGLLISFSMWTQNRLNLGSFWPCMVIIRFYAVACSHKLNQQSIEWNHEFERPFKRQRTKRFDHSSRFQCDETTSFETSMHHKKDHITNNYQNTMLI